MSIVKTAQTQLKTGATNPNTLAIDCNGGNVLVVALGVNAVAVDYVKYNGVAMTLWSKGSQSGGGNGRIRLYYMANPPSGSNNIEVSQYANPKSIGAVAFSGVDTSDLVEADATSTDGVNPQEVSASQAGSVDSVGIAMISNAWGTSYSPNNGETEISDHQDGEWGNFSSYYKIFEDGSGVKTMGANCSPSDILYPINGILLLNGEATATPVNLKTANEVTALNIKTMNETVKASVKTANEVV